MLLNLGQLPDISIGRPTSVVAFCHWGNIYGGRQSHTENIYPSSEAIIRGLLTINSGHVKEGEGQQGDNAQLWVRGRSGCEVKIR